MGPLAKELIVRSIPKFKDSDTEQKKLYIDEVKKSLKHYQKENLTHDYAVAYMEAAPIFIRYTQMYIK